MQNTTTVRFILVSLFVLSACSSGELNNPDADGPDSDLSDGDTSLQQYQVTITVGEEGRSTPNGAVMVPQGEILELIITPEHPRATATATGCGGILTDSLYQTAPIEDHCAIEVTFEPPPEVTVTVAVTGDGAVSPAAPQQILVGEPFVFALEPLLPGCAITFGGDCSATPNEAMTEVVVTSEADCLLAVDFDCGPSTLTLRPEQVGVFWENRTQQFTATRTFDSGEIVDATTAVEWSSLDPAVVSIDASGLATALIDHGVVDIVAEIPGRTPEVRAETTMTVVHVGDSGWHPDYLDVVVDYEVGEVYLDGVVITGAGCPGSGCTWSTLDWRWSPRPWEPHPNTVSGRLWFLWSEDGGLTYNANAWDWIGNTTTHKGLETPVNTAWIGTMVSTVCDLPSWDPVYPWCNGRERSNIYFTTPPGY